MKKWRYLKKTSIAWKGNSCLKKKKKKNKKKGRKMEMNSKKPMMNRSKKKLKKASSDCQLLNKHLLQHSNKYRNLLRWM